MATLIQLLENTLASKDALLPNATKRILLKETLQSITLDYLYNHRSYRSLNLYGGACLRVVYGLNRLSEDVDLDNQQKIDLSTLVEDLANFIHSALGYRDASVKRQTGQGGILRVSLMFPVLQELGLSPLPDEALHMKLEISHHRQVAIIKYTPVIAEGRSFVPSHFSIETMMAGKMLACLERSFQKGKSVGMVKGRDWYDLLWFMQQRIQPLEEKLEQDGQISYNVKSAVLALLDKAEKIHPRHLEIDLLPLFEQRAFIERWIEVFHDNLHQWAKYYLETSSGN